MAHRVIVGLPRLHLGGPDVFAKRLVRGLVSLGHDARILLTEDDCLRVAGSRGRQPLPADVPCDRLPAGANDTWGQRWEALERYLEERSPCFYLMLHDWRNNVIAPRLSRRVRLIGLVQADSPLDIDQAARLGPFWDAIVAVSEPLQSKVAGLVPHLARRIVTIRNAVPTLDVQPTKAMDGPLRIAYSGELRRHQKRLDDIIDVARGLAGRTNEFQVTFFGDGPHRDHLEERCRDLTARGLVIFAGRLENTELLQELATQHVLLLTSEFEGLSIALLEAMSRGCVPVVSRLASQALVVRDGANSLTANVGDIDGFIAHLERLASDRRLLAQLGSEAFSTIATGGYRVQDMLDSYLALFDRLGAADTRGGFARQRGDLVAPPTALAGVEILTGECSGDARYVNAGVAWPDPPVPVQRGVKPPTSGPADLEKHRIIVAATSGTISGVDVFAGHLVRGLRARGLDAMLHGPRLTADSGPLASPEGVTYDERDPVLDDDSLGWCNRWRLMIQHLERLAPCIYVPNYDDWYSCISPCLSEGIRVVGIGHSDDPWHYDHLCRIGHGCDAIVGVSRAISDHLRTLVPEWATRIETIPYGIPGVGEPATPVERRRSPSSGDVLKIIYSGRLVLRQKRAIDVVAVARELARRCVPFEMAIVGDGDLRTTMERAAHDLVLDRRLWFTGAQPNAAVLELLSAYDAYLMPSAFEGLSVGMLEAMSRGVVPVATDIRSGVPDVVIPGENGLVAPVGDVTAFADRLEWLWRNPDERRRLSAAAARTAGAGYGVDRMVDRYVELFRRIVAEPTRRTFGPIVPPRHLTRELTWSLWARRVAADPAASARRVIRRLGRALG